MFSILGLILGLWLLKQGRYELSSGILSFLLVTVVMYSLFSTKEYDQPFYFFIHYFLFLIYIVFSGLFAQRRVLITNSVIITGGSIAAYLLYLPLMPENVSNIAQYGVFIYVFAVILIFSLTLLFSGFIRQSVSELKIVYDDAQKQNEKMQNLVEKVKHNAEKLNEAGGFLTNLSDTVARNADNEAEEISAAMEEMLTAIVNNTNYSEKSYSKFQKSSDNLK